jgi:hypothetical protein
VSIFSHYKSWDELYEKMKSTQLQIGDFRMDAQEFDEVF